MVWEYKFQRYARVCFFWAGLLYEFISFSMLFWVWFKLHCSFINQTGYICVYLMQNCFYRIMFVIDCNFINVAGILFLPLLFLIIIKEKLPIINAGQLQLKFQLLRRLVLPPFISNIW